MFIRQLNNIIISGYCTKLLVLRLLVNIRTTYDATGVKKYAPVTKEDIVLFKREAEHLRKEIFYAIEEFKWKEEKRKSHITSRSSSELIFRSAL